MSTSRVYTVNEVLPASFVNDFPQGILAWNTSGADVGPTSGTTELDIITASAVTVAGSTRRLKISFHCRNLTGTVTADIFIIRIKEGSTILQEYHCQISGGGAAANFGIAFSAIISPIAASHTYKATITRVIGTGTGTLSGTSGAPLTIAVEDIGQA